MKSEAADDGEVEEEEEQERVEVKKEKVEKEAAMEEGEEGVVEDTEEEEEEVMKETVWSSCSQSDDRSKDLTEEPLNFFGQALCAFSPYTKALKEQEDSEAPPPPRGPCPSPLP